MKLKREFYAQDVLIVAPALLGKTLVRKFNDGTVFKSQITETEAYRGEEDLASHARHGLTPRNKIMYESAGYIYIYFIYGMYWLFNIITGQVDQPQGVLIRGLSGVTGPGRVGKILKLDKSFYGEDITKSSRLWIENTPQITNAKIINSKRIGVEYAKEWSNKPWRFTLQSEDTSD